jgi:hypothetical protein
MAGTCPASKASVEELAYTANEIAMTIFDA